MSEQAVENLETLWERLTEGIDRAGPQHEVLFLSKLALLLGDALQDVPRVEQSIAAALQDLG